MCLSASHSGCWFWRDLLAVEAKELEDPIENNRFLHLKEDPQSHVWLEPLSFDSLLELGIYRPGGQYMERVTGGSAV